MMAPLTTLPRSQLEPACATCGRQTEEQPAREHGWRASRAPLIAFIDDDCVPAPDAMATLTAALDDADAVGAGMRPLAAAGLISSFVAAEGLVSHRVASTGDIRYLVTAGFAVRRSVLESVGGFDLAFAGAAGEDVDLSLRLMAEGYRLRIEPGAVIYHDHRDLASNTWRACTTGVPEPTTGLAPNTAGIARKPRHPSPRTSRSGRGLTTTAATVATTLPHAASRFSASAPR